MLPCAKDHLLSACAINRVHDGGERSSENHSTNGARSTLDGHSEVKQRSYTGFPAFISHNSHPLRLTIGKLGLVKFSRTTRRAPHISLSIQCRLRVMVSSRTIESSDFT